MKPSDTPIKLIVGLGNPGADYQHTRHNAGQDLVEQLAQHYGQSITSSNTPKFFGNSTRIIMNGRDLRLLVPTTFMNKSGQAVAAISQFYKIPPQAILVVHDELDLAPGTARLKIGGGHGGHNGLRDIISSLGNIKDFARLRLGIGHPGNAKQVANYVLKKASPDDQISIQSAIDNALKIIPLLTTGSFEPAMLELHTQNTTP